MTGEVIILGARGRFGRAALDAFLEAGWSVRAFARSWEHAVGRAGVEPIAGDAFDASALVAAAQGCDVIVNALNPAYPRWACDLPRITGSVIEAARASGATVMMPGTVYNYGEGMPERLAGDTPDDPTTRKGRLRVEMEQAYAHASREGVRTIILNAGDFIERERTGNWFDSRIVANIAKGHLMYPGPLDRMHAWAYLPDMARAMVGLADKRTAFAAFERFGFNGYALTGRMLVDAVERVSGRKLKVRGLPWPVVRLLGLVMPQMREVAEMSYLWRVRHGIDDARLAAVLPDLQATSLDAALSDALGGFTSRRDLRPAGDCRT